MSRTRGLLAGASRDEGGFTLTEVAVALSVLLVALVALARTATVAFTDVALARQRQTASHLANEILESVRGLPYKTVAKGLRDSDAGGDPRIVACSGQLRYPSCATGEPLVHTPGLPATPPLVPHTGQVGPPDYTQTYRWAVYVTQAAGVPEEGAYRVTVEVSWERGARAGVSTTVQAQTLIFAPDGCVDTETHPFGAPCQPYFYANGGQSPGVIATTGTIQEVDFDTASIDLVGVGTDIQVEQTIRVEGQVNLPALGVTVGGEETVEVAGVVSTADDDPSAPAGEYDTTPVGPQAPRTISVAGGDNQLAVAVEGGATGQTTSTVSATASNACNLQLDSRPCGFSTGTQGAQRQTLSAGGAGTAVLASVGESTTPIRVFGHQDVGTGGGDGLAHLEVQRSLPEVRVGGLPDGIAAPAGWQGYLIRLTGYSGSASAQSGTGTSAPTSVVGGGTVEYWNGSGYSTTTVTGAGAQIPVSPVDHEDQGAGVRVEMAAEIAVEPSTTAQTASGTTRTEARGDLGAPLVGEITYRISMDGSEVADLVVAVNLGRARTATIYQPAPSP